MGNRNHLHVCQRCGIVQATSSSTAPRRCFVCDGLTFSEYEPDGDPAERVELDPLTE